MNKRMKFLGSALAAILALAFAATARAQQLKTPSNAQGEQFYVISSVDTQKYQIVLMYPTQLTVVGTTTDQTIYLGEKNEKLALKDLRAGQTVWASLRKDKNGQETLVRIREGAMSVAELHKLYLDFPAK